MNRVRVGVAVATTIVSLVVVRGSARAAEPVGDPRGIVIEEVRNDCPSFMVRVDVDKQGRTYAGGEEMRVSVVSAKSGYLYLLYCDAGGTVTCMFPNAFGQDHRIAENRPIVIPQPPRPGQSSFRLRIGPPYGREVLKAIVSLTPMDSGVLGRLLSSQGVPGRLDGVRAVYVEEASAVDWAEHHVEIITHDPTASPGTNERPANGGPSRRPGVASTMPAENTTPAVDSQARRVGVFIGISEFADERIRDLSVGHTDASTVADVMRQHCKIDRGWVLLNEQATRKNIEHVLRRQVAAATRPGDSVIIYWSGHGSRCADDGGDEKDGFDEYLVPHDGRLDDVQTIRNTMVLDDTFGRWVQELDGRRVLVVLDTCHSGGQTAAEKSLAKGLFAAPIKAVGEEFDFLDGEFDRIKDIGQRDTALLASSMASQVSFERRERDLSAMTYFLVSQLQSGTGPVTLADAFSQLKRSVAQYVQKSFPGTTQTPVLVNNLSGPFYLRP